MDGKISIELAFALQDKQVIIPLRVVAGTTLYEAACQSNICTKFSQIDLDKMPMGIFGQAVKNPKEQVVQAGDRIEIYRPLICELKAKKSTKSKK